MSDDGPTLSDEHYEHVTAEPCEDCQAEIKRLTRLSIAAGVVIGCVATFAILKAQAK